MILRRHPSPHPPLRSARSLGALAVALTMAACAPMPAVRYAAPPQFGNGYPEKLAVDEPGPAEVVVIVNDNEKMVHAGMFAGPTLLDPAGSYDPARRPEAASTDGRLADYLRFQLEDGPVVRVYRFALPPERFARIKARLDAAGRTMPLFCAAKVQNILSGIAPFEAVPDAWLITPANLARHLDHILTQDREAGACLWPDGASCYPQPADEAIARAAL